MADYTSKVINAQAGDMSAYAELVTEFQDVAFASACSWLSDRDLAKDATQEAFLDAYLHLSQLQNPTAFPGWLRKIVVKHCDRQTRRKSYLRSDTDPDYVDPDNTSPDDTQGAMASPLATAISQQEQARVRLAVERLPEKLRLIVALHYFGDASGQQIAGFLELPLSTVKQRLRVARQQLKESDIMTIKQMQQAPKRVFTDEIAMFIALREGNLAAVEKLIRQSPALLDAQQDWNRELVYEGVLPFATRATPLITAIELGDLDMQRLLVDAGADVNGLCGCATGEPPIWTAALLQREQQVEHLLAHGADANVRSASGNTPLHIAAMRGYANIVQMLLENGADQMLIDLPSDAIWPLTAGSQDKPGWTAIEWARHKGHHQIVRMLEGGMAAKDIAPVNEFRLDADIIHTGIKALDFFTPIKKGSLVRIPFKAGVGMLVLLGELSQGYLSQPTGEVIWTGFTQPPFDLADLEAEMLEFGLRNRVRMHLSSYQQNEQVQRETFQQGLAELDQLRNTGRDVLAVIQSVAGFETDIEESLLRLSESSGPGSVTSFVLTPFRDKDQSWDELQAPYLGQISLDRRRALANLYPSNDPCRSLTGLTVSDLTDDHLALLSKVKTIFSAYDARDPEFLEKGDDPEDQRVKRLVHYFTQPFKVSEPFRGTPGESVSRDKLLDGIRTILAAK